MTIVKRDDKILPSVHPIDLKCVVPTFDEELKMALDELYTVNEKSVIIKDKNMCDRTTQINMLHRMNKYTNFVSSLSIGIYDAFIMHYITNNKSILAYYREDNLLHVVMYNGDRETLYITNDPNMHLTNTESRLNILLRGKILNILKEIK
jgi:hypothetical protein